MTGSQRAARITKLQQVLKKHKEFAPAAAVAEHSLLEQLLYAACLENATFENAAQAFAKLTEVYVDWNEVRVTTVAELGEELSFLPDPQSAGSRLKRTLQSIYEEHYEFDLESLKKQNLGKAVEAIEKYAGVTPFMAAFVTQRGLGGHAIPLDDATLACLLWLEILSDADAEKRLAPGLERAIPKAQGVEFATLLHQLGAEFWLDPQSPRVRKALLEVEPRLKTKAAPSGEQLRAAAAKTAAAQRAAIASAEAEQRQAAGAAPAEGDKPASGAHAARPASTGPTASGGKEPPASKGKAASKEAESAKDAPKESGKEGAKSSVKAAPAEGAKEPSPRDKSEGDKSTHEKSERSSKERRPAKDARSAKGAERRGPEDEDRREAASAEPGRPGKPASRSKKGGSRPAKKDAAKKKAPDTRLAKKKPR